MNTRAITPRQQRQPARGAAVQGPPAAAALSSTPDHVGDHPMHMAPRDNRPPPLARRNARRWLIVAALLITVALVALLVARLRALDEQITAAAARYECARLAQIDNREPAECARAATSTEAQP